MLGTQKRRLKKIHREAGEWISKMDRGLSGQEHEALIQWLARDPLHSDAFEKQKRNWGRLDSLVDWRPEHSAEMNPDLLAPSKSSPAKILWYSGILLGGCAALVMLGLFVSHPGEIENNPEVIGNDEIATQVLMDGSVLLKHGFARYEVKYTDEERRIDLIEGEVYFDVAKNPNRPFIVSTTRGDVRAVGTSFNVKVSEQEMRLLVEEGVVAFRTPEPKNQVQEVEPAELDADEQIFDIEKKEPLYVSANQQVTVYGAGVGQPTIVELVTVEDVKREISWQHRKLIFKDESLRKISTEFNRLNQVQLVVAESNLAEITISGSIASDNIDGFLHLLEIGFGIASEQIDDKTILLYDPLTKNP